MAWRRPGNKPLSERRMEIYWRIYASLGLNELTVSMLINGGEEIEPYLLMGQHNTLQDSE